MSADLKSGYKKADRLQSVKTLQTVGQFLFLSSVFDKVLLYFKNTERPVLIEGGRRFQLIAVSPSATPFGAFVSGRFPLNPLPLLPPAPPKPPLPKLPEPLPYTEDVSFTVSNTVPPAETVYVLPFLMSGDENTADAKIHTGYQCNG